MAKNPAAVAYQGYYDHHKGQTTDGWDMEEWHELSDDQRAAWWAATQALVEELLGSGASLNPDLYEDGPALTAGPLARAPSSSR